MRILAGVSEEDTMAKKGKTRTPKHKRKSVMKFDFGQFVHAEPGFGRHAMSKPHAHVPPPGQG